MDGKVLVAKALSEQIHSAFYFYQYWIRRLRCQGKIYPVRKRPARNARTSGREIVCQLPANLLVFRGKNWSRFGEIRPKLHQLFGQSDHSSEQIAKARPIRRVCK